MWEIMMKTYHLYVVMSLNSGYFCDILSVAIVQKCIMAKNGDCDTLHWALWEDIIPLFEIVPKGKLHIPYVVKIT